MEYYSQIKYHAEELHKLLSQEPNNAMFARLTIVLSTTIINSPRFKDIDAAPPDDTGGTGGVHSARPISQE